MAENSDDHLVAKKVCLKEFLKVDETAVMLVVPMASRVAAVTGLKGVERLVHCLG